MPKYIILLIAIVIAIIYPQKTLAATITPTIGNLDPNTTKPVTISGLDGNKLHSLVIRKVTSRDLLGAFNWSQTQKICINSDTSGKIVKDLGPFNNPGFYSLNIYKATGDTNNCLEQSGGLITFEQFTVGGLINDGTPDGKNCCVYPKIFYNAGNDICQETVSTPWSPNGEPTKCQSIGAFCEPQSVKCFSSRTMTVNGKICEEDPDNPKHTGDSNYIICPLGGGKKIPGCTDATMPNPNNPGKTIPNPGIATAIGCIHTRPAELAKDLLKFVIAISGGIAFLLMLLGAFQMLTSAGNPDHLNAGRERLTNAVIGLLFVIFAILFFKILGVDILQIPGFK